MHTKLSNAVGTLLAKLRLSSGAALVGFGARTVADKLGESISFYDLGAVGDGVTDDTAAIQAAIAGHLARGIPLVTGAGRFRVTQQIAIDVSSLLTNTGVCIRGAGRRRTILVSSYSAGVPFLITGSPASFFHAVKDIGFEANYAGPAFQVGKNDYSDAFNSCTLTGINVNNSSTDPAAEVSRLNYVLQSEIDIVANGSGSGRPTASTAPGTGTAIVLRQVQFCDLRLAAGNANTGLKITDGYSFSNTYKALDIEEVNVGLQIDSPTATKNNFIGGTIVATYCINNTAGASNVLFGTNLSPYTTGSIIKASNNVGTTINVPGSGLAVNNMQTPDSLPGSTAALKAVGPDANIGISIQSKGAGGVDFSDGTGAQMFGVRYTANAVNSLRAIPTSTGNGVTLDTVGADTNIDSVVRAKGVGSVKATSSNGSTLLVAGGGSFINYPQVNGSASGLPVAYQALGADTNIDLQLIPKGTGVVQFGALTASADAPVTGYITIRDAGGTLRKLAVIA